MLCFVVCCWLVCSAVRVVSFSRFCYICVAFCLFVCCMLLYFVMLLCGLLCVDMLLCVLLWVINVYGVGVVPLLCCNALCKHSLWCAVVC